MLVYETSAQISELANFLLTIPEPMHEKVTHIKGRLLYQAIILYNYTPFQNGTSLKGKNWERILSYKSSSSRYTTLGEIFEGYYFYYARAYTP